MQYYFVKNKNMIQIKILEKINDNIVGKFVC